MQTNDANNMLSAIAVVDGIHRVVSNPDATRRLVHMINEHVHNLERIEQCDSPSD